MKKHAHTPYQHEIAFIIHECSLLIFVKPLICNLIKIQLSLIQSFPFIQNVI